MNDTDTSHPAPKLAQPTTSAAPKGAAPELGSQNAGGAGDRSAEAEAEPGVPADPPRVESMAQAERRWRREGRDLEVAAYRGRAREEYQQAHPRCSRRDAHEYAWRAAVAKFPPESGEGANPEAVTPLIAPVAKSKAHDSALLPAADSGRIKGLSEIPAEWPELPENASLQAEIGWVQAQRLRIVEEQPSGATVVHLERAGSPAPSWAALGWLETSIRSYAKYVDVVARSLSTQPDERELVQRERLAIEEIHQLLRQMKADRAVRRKPNRTPPGLGPHGT